MCKHSFKTTDSRTIESTTKAHLFMKKRRKLCQLCGFKTNTYEIEESEIVDLIHKVANKTLIHPLLRRIYKRIMYEKLKLRKS